MSQSFTIMFMNPKAVRREVKSEEEVIKILQGAAKESFISAPRKLPFGMHKLISDHNKKLLNK